MFRLVSLTILFLVGVTEYAGPVRANDPSIAAVTTDLKDMLEKGLKARRPSEFEFIATVLAKVESGELPESLVRSTFAWARKQPVNMFQYFQAGLRERAKRIGVTL